MTKQRKWEDLTKSEKKAGIITLSVLGLIVIGAVGSVSNAINGGSGAQQVEGSATTAPQVTYKEVTETESVPFEKTTQPDSSRDVGTSAVTTAGVNGVRTKTYKLTMTDGKETDRVEVKNEVTTLPVNEVTSVGARQPYVAPAPAPQSNCDSNYSSACVPVASDVDCGGGSGNGPAYFYGTATVVGTDIYDLDRDGDGIACE